MNQGYSDLLLIFIILILFFLVIYLLFKNNSNTSIQENDTINVQKNISEIQGSIILLTKTVEEKINNINKNIGSSLNEQTEKTQKAQQISCFEQTHRKNTKNTTLIKKQRGGRRR